MPTTTQQIMDAAQQAGKLLADHPAVEKYRQAQQAVTQDPDATRLLGEFERQLETLGRAQQMGQGISEDQRRSFEALQLQISSHIRIKALNMAQVEFVDLLRRITQEIHKPIASLLGEAGGGGNGAGPGGPRLVQ